MTRTEPDAASRALLAHRRWIDELLAEARRLRHDRPATAAELCRAAATVAWLNHCGEFTLPELEELLAEIGAAQLGTAGPGGTRRRLAGGGPPAERAVVLHVISQAYDTGGHTRLVTRWIDLDPRHEHRIVLTAQAAAPLPEVLRARTGSARPVALRGSPDGLLGVAAQLQDHLAGADLVVLHHHPNDVTPVLALSGMATRPPVAVLNHAEHWYWVGAGIADAVICYEEKGARLCVERRGIERRRLPILPLPLDDAHLDAPLPDKAAAKRALGLAADEVVFLTVARPGKFEAEGQPHLADLLGAFARDTPGVAVIAVGPADEGRWHEAAVAAGGRLLPVGVQHPLQPWIDAADVALESYPLGSTTALLEAVLAGAVPVTFRFDPAVVRLFTSDPFGAGHVLVDDVADVVPTLRALATDHEDRRRQATRCRAGVLERHGRRGWARALDAAYAGIDALEPVHGAPADPARHDGPEAADRFLVRQLVAEGSALPEDQLRGLASEATAISAGPELSVVLLAGGGSPAHLEAELGARRVEWIEAAGGDAATAVSRSSAPLVLLVRDDLTGPPGWVDELVQHLRQAPQDRALLPIVQGEGRAPSACLLVRGVPARAGARLPFTPIDTVLHRSGERRWTSFLAVPEWDGDLEARVQLFCRTFTAGDPVTLVLADDSRLELDSQIGRLSEALAATGVDDERLPDVVLSTLRAEPADNGVGAVLWWGAADDGRRPEPCAPVSAQDAGDLRRLAR